MHKTPNFMEIANPIYDVVFKYLMEDNKVAKIFLSAITGLEITNLEFIPQELVVDKTKTNENKFLTARSAERGRCAVSYGAQSLGLQTGFLRKGAGSRRI